MRSIKQFDNLPELKMKSGKLKFVDGSEEYEAEPDKLKFVGHYRRSGEAWSNRRNARG